MTRGRPKGSGRKGVFHKFHLPLFEEESNEIRTLAREWHFSLQATFERIIGLGLMLYNASRSKQPIIIRKKSELDKEIIIV